MVAHTLQDGTLENHTGCIPPHYLLTKPLELAQRGHSLKTVCIGMTTLSQDDNLDGLRADVAAVMEHSRNTSMTDALHQQSQLVAKKRRVSTGTSPDAAT